ncbi:MAG: hypothetical protein KC613_23280, partial [Myxococcales bacterium]|nr:hypothetical protein [Myxococcales bacterium]
SPLFDFGPDGLQFQAPATLRVAFPGPVPEGQRAALAWLDGDTWVELPGAQTACAEGEGCTVVAGVEHFTTFAVVLRDGMLQVTGACEDALDTFAACGGDLVGRWNIAALCYPIPEGGEPVNPIEQFCPDSVLSATYTQTGSYTFGGDGTLAVVYAEEVSTRALDVPWACFDDNMQPRDCSLLDDFFGGGGVCFEAATGCRCEHEERSPIDRMFEAQWAAAGDAFTIDPGDGPSDPVPYCIAGDELRVQF